jgi:hypothetical protein
MPINSSGLLSGRDPVVAYDQLSNTRYQFLRLGEAEPSLGASGQGNVLTLGVSNSRVWTDQLSVTSVSATGNIEGGNLLAGNIVIPATGNVDLGNVNINNLAAPYANSDAVTKLYVDTQIGNIGTLGNLTIANTTISTTLANGNITLTSTGNQLVQISGTAGVVVPSGNTDQRPGSPITGTLRVNTALSQIEAWDGLAWIAGSGGSGNVTITDQQITPDGSSLTYTLDQDTDQASILVSFNGVAQLPGLAYTVTGNSITFGQAPQTTDIIDIRFLASPLASDRVLNSTGNARVQVYDNSTIFFNTNTANVASITAAGVFNLSTGHSLQLPVYNSANASVLANVATGQVIYVTDGDSGNPCLAVYSGGAFRRISFGANISP